MYNYALMCNDGEGVEKNKEEAMKFFKMAANKEDTQSMIVLAGLLKKEPLEEDRMPAEKLIKTDAIMGYAPAILQYSYILLVDKKEYKKAAKFFLKAAKKGDPNSMFKYAFLLWRGIGVVVNKSQAEEYIRKAILKFNTVCMKTYGLFLSKTKELTFDFCQLFIHFKMAISRKNADITMNSQNDIIVEDGRLINFEKFAREYEIKADTGDSYSMYVFGSLLIAGYGRTKDEEEGIKYLQRASSYKRYNKKSLNDTKQFLIELFQRNFGPNKYGDDVSNKLAPSLTMVDGKVNINSVHLFKVRADHGDVESMHRYAIAIINGDGVDVNKKGAAHYFKMAADREHILSMFYYAEMPYKGNGIEMNKKESAEYFKRSIDLGYFDSLPYLVALINDKIDINMTPFEKAKYVKFSADAGSARSMNQYGKMLLYGDGIPIDKEEAAKYLNQAADKGNIEAMKTYGVILYKGDGIKMDKKIAIRYLKMSADQGNSDTMYIFGKILIKQGEYILDKEEQSCYLNMAYKQENNVEISRYYYLFRKNEILKLNKNDGIRYLQNSSDKGNLYSMFHFGLMLINGDGIESDKNKGFKYIKKVADAMFLYGKCKLNECISDKKEAVNYLKMASDKSHPDSLLEYGNLLIKGDFVPMNKEEGLRCIKTSVNKGYVNAIFQFGLMLFKGEEMKMNKKEGLMYIKKSVDKGCPKAMHFYGNLLLDGIEIPMNKKEGIHYIQLSADKGNMKAMHQFGLLLLNNNEIITPNPTEAAKYIKKAADKNDPDSTFFIRKDAF